MNPRFLIGGTNSGCGKTTVVCALLQALTNRGKKLMACKSGPDYIDPMFHSRVIGTESCNLDLFFTDSNTARFLLKRHSSGCDLTVLEGAMGYYDGIALSSEASAWALARETRTPAILVVDARGSGVSLCAAIQGFLGYQEMSCIQGVILNRISPMLYPRLKGAIEGWCGVKVYGYLPALPDCSIESRHLGLLTAGEIADLKGKLDRLAAQAEQSLDLDGLLRLAAQAPELDVTPLSLPEPVPGHPRIAVAKDEAFCFYYRDNLELLKELGAELAEFSPLHSSALPPCDGLYLGGGYPELYGKQLSCNCAMRSCIKEAIQSGLPAIAECGGFLYLQEKLEDAHGGTAPVCGVIAGRGFPTSRLQRFGYVELTAREDNLLCGAGESLRAHEFHYWDCDDPGRAFRAQKPQSNRGWDCAHATATLYAGFPHLYFYANPKAAARFLTAAAEYRKKRS